MNCPTNLDLQTEVEALRELNMRLTSTVQELRLETSYYQGMPKLILIETRHLTCYSLPVSPKGEVKKIQWEKDLLKQEVKNMSGLFKNWMNEAKTAKSKRICEDPELLSIMVEYPAQPISEMLSQQVSSKDNSPLALVTCQYPYFIEVSAHLFLSKNTIIKLLTLFFQPTIVCKCCLDKRVWLGVSRNILKSFKEN